MSRDVNAQLRITAWPAAPLPLPMMSRVVCQLDDGRELLLPYPAPLRGPKSQGFCFESERVALSGETYLRLGEIDLGDPDAILAFVNEYGPLGGSRAFAEITKDEHL